jgi:hypothetical protein
MTTGWGAWRGPQSAYELTAAVAVRDTAAADAVLEGQEPGELWGVCTALGAQARHAAWVTRADRLAQQDRAATELAGLPGAAAIASHALMPEPRRVPRQWPSERDLVAAARCLAGITVATMQAAGWSGPSVAVLCRRACPRH